MQCFAPRARRRWQPPASPGATWARPTRAGTRCCGSGRSRACARSGGSTTQSLARGTGSIETDWLNGEIVLLGRLHGVPVPANGYFVDLSARLVREGRGPGAVSVAEIEAGLAAAGVVVP